MVTRNRDDFQELNEAFYRSGEQHLPILIVTRGLPDVRPDRIAHALKRWADEHADLPAEALLYLVDYLT